MKNLIKLSFLTAIISIFVLACTPPAKNGDETKTAIDSPQIDSVKTDSANIDTAKNSVDSTKIAH